MRHGGMSQQLLPVLPEQLLAHFRRKFDFEHLEVLQPALRCDEGVVGAEQETVLQARGGFAKQGFRDVFGRPAGQAFNIYMFNTFTFIR
jgi:hypothetical protein